VSGFTPRCPGKYEGGWAPEPIWKSREEKNVVLIGTQTPAPRPSSPYPVAIPTTLSLNPSQNVSVTKCAWGQRKCVMLSLYMGSKNKTSHIPNLSSSWGRGVSIMRENPPPRVTYFIGSWESSRSGLDMAVESKVSISAGNGAKRLSLSSPHLSHYHD
jgi:hypothetical protein